jgi:hypothetical protein
MLSITTGDRCGSRTLQQSRNATDPEHHARARQNSLDPASVAVGTALRPYGLGPPPAQIPASGITALGSYLGYVAAKRTSG